MKYIIIMILCLVMFEPGNAQNGYIITDKGIMFLPDSIPEIDLQLIIPDSTQSTDTISYDLDTIALEYLKRVAKDYRFNYKRYLKYSELYAEYIKAASEKWDIPIEIIEAVITIESRWAKNAKGYADCNGLMQVQGGVFDVSRNINSGTGILKDRLIKFLDDMGMALTAYNRGPGGARKYLRKHGHISNYAVRALAIAERFEMYRIMKNISREINQLKTENTLTIKHDFENDNKIYNRKNNYYFAYSSNTSAVGLFPVVQTAGKESCLHRERNERHNGYLCHAVPEADNNSRQSENYLQGNSGTSQFVRYRAEGVQGIHSRIRYCAERYVQHQI